jgi:signal transduction histidine kinase
MLFAHQKMQAPALQMDGQPNIGDLRFVPDDRVAPSFGYSADRWWARVTLPPLQRPDTRFARLDAPAADRFAAFEGCAGTAWRRLPRIEARYAVFRIDPSDPGCEILLMQETRSIVRFGVTILPSSSLAAIDAETLVGVTLGVGLAVSCMAAFLWQATQRQEFFHFVAYQAATVLVIARVWGFVPGLMLGHPAWLGPLIGVAGINLWVLEFFNYVQTSLKVSETHPALSRWFRLLALSAAAATLGQALGLHFQWPLSAINMGAGVCCWAVVITIKWTTQRRRAIQQLLGYLPTLACFCVYLASMTGYTQLADLRTLFLLGQLGTTLALGFWMAREFRMDRDRRERVLAVTVGELEQNRTVLERYQSDLENMVASRTVELQRALQNERAIVAQQRDFTAMIGHEFRTPLAVIDGQARRIARSDVAEDDLLRRSREIRDAVRDMIGLMDGLLFHARHDSGATEYRFEKIDLASILGRAAESSIQRERLEDLCINCPATITCLADRLLLITAIGNILGNAAKYSTPGQRIEVAAQADADWINLTVTDYGAGIAECELETVFARFQRGSNVLTTAGSGLGLFVARQILEGHGGRITVTSRLKFGTCFTLSIPKISYLDHQNIAASGHEA